MQQSLNIMDQEKIREKLFIFDLDDTLIHTTKYDPEYWVKNFLNLRLYKNVDEVLTKIGPDRCMLLTYDKHGLQSTKIEILKLESRFKELYIVKDKTEKYVILKKLKTENPDLDVVVVGDRHEDGELQYGKSLGLKTICVGIEGNYHFNNKFHCEYDLVIENEDQFSKIPEIK